MTTERFSDFDVERDPLMSPDQWAVRSAKLKRDAVAFLAQRYNLDNDVDPYYMERALVRLAGTGVRPSAGPARMRTVDLDDFDVSLPETGLDWDPRRVFAARGFDADAGVRYMARRVAGVKLNVDYRHSSRFASLPVPYPSEMQHCEINDAVRISRFDRATRNIRVERACYLDQVATNIHCDDVVEALGSHSFREADTDPHTARPLPFEFAIQANTIGVACVFVDRHNRPILRMRRERKDGRSLSVMKAGLHCAASGVLEWKHVANAEGRVDAVSFAHGILKGMTEEIFDECNIVPCDQPYEIGALEFARELPRGGKPQFFMIARFSMLREDLSELIQQKRRGEAKPNEWYEFGDDIDNTLPRSSAGLTVGQIAKMTYEGFGSLIALKNAMPYIEQKQFDFRNASDFFVARP